jgi:signal transduction histidine kinase
MIRLPRSLAFRLAVGYGALVAGAMVAVAAVLYLGTVGVIERGIETKLRAVSAQMTRKFDATGALQAEIQRALADNVDQDTEVYALLNRDGVRIVGNISGIGGVLPDGLSDRSVTRYGRPSLSRLLPRKLSNGDTLIVGRDLADLNEIKQLVVSSLLISLGFALLLATGGAILFRRQLERRIAAIRRIATDIAAGDLTRRIPDSGGEDEFTRLNQSINHMLDRNERLMNGVRDVSNAIAHDLRTPLQRIRALLDEGVSAPGDLHERARDAIEGIHELTGLLDKLLQIAEAEAGSRRRSFRRVALRDVITDVAELYDATAEANGATLRTEAADEAVAFGDKDLLAVATANLIDNALKYGGPGASVQIRATHDHTSVSILVQDDGPGIPPGERDRVVTRFYRLDRSRTLPGNGLGLAIVNAIAELHGGALRLDDAAPGLIARIVLPRFEPGYFPNGNVAATA